MTAATPRYGDIADRFGSGGANSAPSGAEGNPTHRNVARSILGAITPQFADTTALTASLAADRVNGQLAVRVSDYSIWVWKPADATAVDATHIAPTDVGVGAGRWVQKVA